MSDVASRGSRGACLWRDSGAGLTSRRKAEGQENHRMHNIKTINYCFCDAVKCSRGRERKKDRRQLTGAHMRTGRK